jgi:hypothetical protein
MRIFQTFSAGAEFKHFEKFQTALLLQKQISPGILEKSLPKHYGTMENIFLFMYTLHIPVEEFKFLLEFSIAFKVRISFAVGLSQELLSTR